MSERGEHPLRRFGRRIQAARLVLTLESLGPILWPALSVAGVFLALTLFGLWRWLPLPLHLVGLLAFIVAFAACLWRARPNLRLADRARALNRLEEDSAVRHQPLRGLEDRLPPSVEDPVTRRLWEMHQERLARSVARLRLRPPRSLMPLRDPWALRALLLLVLVVAAVHARGQFGVQLASAFALTRSGPAEAVARVDLWVTPPAYTRRAPLGSEQTRGQDRLEVPAGSAALAQVHHLTADSAEGVALVMGDRAVPFTRLGDGSFEARLDLAAPGWLAVRDADENEIARWFVDATPDSAPSVRFAAPPEPTYRRTLRVQAEAEDDFGIAELALRLTPGVGDGETERLLLVRPANRPPRSASSTFLDLTAHPLAGLPVRLRLLAVDGIGQEGASDEIEMTLPAREFRHPLARAIIEQRRELVRDPGTMPDVAGRLAALAETEIALSLPTTVPLSLRVAAARLGIGRDEGAAARASVVDLLWELALFIEDGALSVAERKLRELQDQLRQALNEGATDAELERLMQELQQALNEFLDEMTRQALEQAERGEQPQLQPGPNPNTVERQDLQEMLDRARELMRSGARDAAQDMLAQLQETLENLRAGTAQAQMSPGERALSDLQKMIQMQQQLLERSFQMQREQNGQGQQSEGRSSQGQSQQGQPRQGQSQQGQSGTGEGQMGAAAMEQEALRRALGELMRRLGESGMELPRAMGQAELQMRDARGSLEGGEPGAAADAQNQAVDAMQRAGQAMMEQLQQQAGEQPGPGQQPSAQQRRGRDPLGRATRNDGGYDTRGVEVPSESDLGRARDVLEELYRRSGDRRRSPAELDYYDRLLDRF